MSKILCIGEALIDMICIDKGKSLSEGNNFLKKTGGAPTNVAAAIAALGGVVELSAKVGTDPFGKQLVEEMQHFGVSTKYMLQDSDFFTTFAFVSLMEDGERDFYFNRGADGQLTRDEVNDIELDDISIIHFGSATAFLPGPLQAAYQHLLQKALQRNIFISFDPNYRLLLFKNNDQTFIDQSWNFLACCHFFKLSDEEAMLITGKQTLQDAASVLLEKTTASFAITLGKEGTMLGFDNATSIITSIPVKPVDTTGAGDAFVGAVLYQLMDKSLTQIKSSSIITSIPVKPVDTTGAGDAFVGAVLYQLMDKSLTQIKSLSISHWQQIIGNANKAGARTCEYMGAMDAFKHLNNQIFD